jgi:hypothetical protein
MEPDCSTWCPRKSGTKRSAMTNSLIKQTVAKH